MRHPIIPLPSDASFAAAPLLAVCLLVAPAAFAQSKLAGPVQICKTIILAFAAQIVMGRTPGKFTPTPVKAHR